MPLIRPLQPGQSVGDYQLVRSVAEGALATTWQAQGKGGLVALDTIPIVSLDDPEMEDVFLEETAAALAVQHPNVARLIEASRDRGFLFAASEWVEGTSLATILKAASSQGRLPLDVALLLVRDLCGAVAAIHAQNLVHRAISPSGVQISAQATLKLTALGLGAVLTKSSSSTTFRHMVGKFSYLSPEQLWSRPVDARSDVFSLGLVCYECIGGQHPFRGRNERETTANILSQTASPSFDAIEPALVAWLQRALAKDASGRFSSAIEMRDALLPLLGSLAVASSADLSPWLDGTNIPEPAPSIAIPARRTSSRPAPALSPSSSPIAVSPTAVLPAPSQSAPASSPYPRLLAVGVAVVILGGVAWALVR